MSKILKSPPDYSNFKKLAEKRIQSDDVAPSISGKMLNQVSDQRRAMLEGETEMGLFREPGIDALRKLKGQSTPLGNVIGFSKKADVSSSGSGSGYNYRGSGGTVRQGPNLYSPLWLLSNINLPRDRGTINSWCRAYYGLNAFVQNAISLHCTYPISKLNIKCKDKKIQQFFETLNEEINLADICTQIALDYWLLGEAFPYAELNEASGKISRISLQNPDYIIVQNGPIAGESLMSLRPDESLRRLVMSNKSFDVQQVKKMDKRIIDLVKQGKNIPLDSSCISHLARKISPVDIRGTGLLVSCFKPLMLFENIRECYSIDTEVLTDQGFKKITDLIEIKSNTVCYDKHANGVQLNEKGEIEGRLTLKNNFKVACFNKENENLEYHEPVDFHLANYSGKMIHISGKKVDVLVTPNHKLLTRKVSKTWNTIQAKDLLEKNKYFRFKTKAKWFGKKIENINICGKEIPTKLYMKILGYILSEGCVHRNEKRYDNRVNLSQLVQSDCYQDMRDSYEEFAKFLGKNVSNTIQPTSGTFAANPPKEIWTGSLFGGKELTQYFFDEIGNGKSAKSIEKKIPRWVMELTPDLLKILLESLVLGDGTHKTNKGGSEFRTYSTISKQLADGVYEAAYKSGYVPNICATNKLNCSGKEITEYLVMWSISTNYGHEPIVYTGEIKQKNNGGGATIHEVDYNDAVWCFEVPTGFFITRRNNKITIQGNCKHVQSTDMINPQTLIKVGGATGEYKATPDDLEKWREIVEQSASDPNFKIITHDSVTFERLGWNGGILDTTNDVAALIKEIYIGLLVPSVLMDGGSDTTYANGGVALDILKARYYNFRNMMTRWLRRKIFAPMSRMNGFYEYVDGQKTLIVPDVDWNHMSLFDAGDYIQAVKELATGEKPVVAKQTLFRSLGLDYEEEKRKIRREMIDQVIMDKEKTNLEALGLPELRALSEDDVIPEVKETPLPGEEGLPGQEEDGLGSMPGVSDSGSNAPVPPGPPPST